MPSIPTDSARRRGVKQGIFLMLLMIVLAPVLGLIFRFGFNMMPWPMGIFVFLLGGGGLLRIIYALFFESKYSHNPLAPDESRRTGSVAAGQPNRELPVGDSSSYIPPTPARAGNWRDTNDLQPPSVTDATTKLLEKEQD